MSTLTVIGAGNIGSHVLPLLVRLREVDRIRIVDPDSYESNNLTSQQVDVHEVGRPKALVQARRLRAVRPDVSLEPVVARVEDVPPGRLRSDLLVGCLDSRRARQRVNEVAWRLGIAWVDAGVHPAEMLVRVSVYIPSSEAACMECAWSERDYELLERVYPCTPSPAAQSTEAPAPLGALAASLQALECGRLLAGDRSMAGKEIVMHARSGRLYRSDLRRSRTCRFDHEIWRIEGALPGRMTIGEALEIGPLSVPGKYFTLSAVCRRCGRRTKALRLTNGAGLVKAKCRSCGGQLQAPGFELMERLDGGLPERWRRRCLSAAGVVSGEIVALGERYVEVS